MKLTPLGDRVIIYACTEGELQKGILLPQTRTADELQPVIGVVQSVGPDVVEYQPGDVVFLRFYDGMRFLMKRQVVILATESEISGKVELESDDAYIMPGKEDEDAMDLN